jgi:hypothetical protein
MLLFFFQQIYYTNRGVYYMLKESQELPTFSTNNVDVVVVLVVSRFN